MLRQSNSVITNSSGPYDREQLFVHKLGVYKFLININDFRFITYPLWPKYLLKSYGVNYPDTRGKKLILYENVFKFN
jgi:hypothetical protein